MADEKTPAPPPAPLTEEQRQQAALDAVKKDDARINAAVARDTALTDAVKPAPPAKPTKPDGVPEKFWNAEKGEVNYKAWGDSHSSLETQFHQTKKPDEKPAADPNAKPVVDPNAKPKSARDTAAEEFSRTGKLSDASYTALAAEGFDRDTVDTYIAGQQAKVAPVLQAIHDGAEGAANYNAMIAWAAENLDEVAIESYNAQLTSKNPAVLKAASAALYAKYRAVVPVEGQHVGGGAPVTTGGAFQSKAEMTAAMGDSRYKTDSAYRDTVVKRMAAARAAGINLFA